MKPTSTVQMARACALFCALFAAWRATAQDPAYLTDIRRDVRDDSLDEKLRLIKKAYSKGDFDLALALSDSIKDTVTFHKQLEGDPGPPLIKANAFERVEELPPAWAQWARGWRYYKIVTLTERAGLGRHEEPVDLALAFPVADTSDLYRELRVARVEPESGALLEIPSQVYGEIRRGDKRRCRLVFFADAPANGVSTYLVFYGNPLAERAEYPTDIHVDGEGYGLDITTLHYVAKLSRQNGQLERLRYTREHGLELYAGGKGHGEPPTLDWSNDYVDQDHFQKLRIRNWPACPNYEVIRGSLCVRVRRWGFPHSPVYPLFSPSRMLIDQTYVFYAGKDYFIKEGVMRAAKDFDLTTMRDDEWVLSGYSFTDSVWLDETGALQEGPVPAGQNESMWGVGFYNRDGRDAFIALWLEHAMTPAGKLLRNGVPTMHYYQHGQLWSRYPLGGGGDLRLKEGTTLWQRNAYLVAPYPKENAPEIIRGVRDRLCHPLEASAGQLPAVTPAQAVGALARPGETADTAPLKPAIWAALREVRDEQLYKINANAVDMGCIYDVRVNHGVAEILMTMPTPGRPVYGYLARHGGGRETEGIRERLLGIEGIRDVRVEYTREPAWTVSRLTGAGRQIMGLRD